MARPANHLTGDYHAVLGRPHRSLTLAATGHSGCRDAWHLPHPVRCAACAQPPLPATGRKDPLAGLLFCGGTAALDQPVAAPGVCPDAGPEERGSVSTLG